MGVIAQCEPQGFTEMGQKQVELQDIGQCLGHGI